MRILVVTHNYPRFAGDPAGAFVARIARGATEHGLEVQVVAPHAPGTAPREMDGAVRVTRFRYGPDRFERVAYTGDLHRGTLFSPLTALAFPAFLLAFRRAVHQAVEQFRPDVIHAHWWLPGGWLASRTGKPYIVTCHGSDVRLLEKWSGFRRLAAPVLRRAGRITTVSRFLASDIQRLVAEAAGSVAVLPMPVDTEHFATGKAVPKLVPPGILYAGNLVPSKGVDNLLRAYAVVRGRGLACGLRILGEGPARADLERLGRELRLDGIEWSDFLPQHRMPVEYGQSTVTVLPTLGNAEGLGLTLVEALLAGSAVVGTRAGGIPEVILHEETGLLVDQTPESLAAALERLLTDEDLRHRLTTAGERHVRAMFGPEHTIKPFLQLYRDVVQHTPGR